MLYTHNIQTTKVGNEIYWWLDKLTCEYREVKLNIELYNLVVIINVLMLKLSETFMLWVFGVSIIFFLRIVGGWIAEKQNKRLRTQVNLCCVKGCIMNLTDGMFYCLEYEWMSNLKYNSVL